MNTGGTAVACERPAGRKATRTSDKRNRVIVIGLDGATFRLLDRWIDQGALPHLQAAIADGVRGTLDSTHPPFSGPAWSTVITGKVPANHGVLDWQARLDKDGRRRLLNLTHVNGDRLWSIFERAGKSVGFINMPFTYPPEAVPGFLIGGLLTPSLGSHFTYPADLKDELLARFPNYQLDLDWRAFNVSRDVLSIAPQLIDMTKTRTEAALWLWEKYDPDLLCVIYIGTDRLQHKVWHVMDPEHPLYQPEFANHEERAALSFYQELDRSIGRLRERAGQDTTVLIISDHGFGPLWTRFYINNWLASEGYLASDYFWRSLLEKFINRLRARVRLRMRLRKLRESFSPDHGSSGFNAMMESIVHSTEDILRRIDWPNTRAYAGAQGEQGIYLNVAGREPHGTVTEANYEAVRTEIMEKLKALKDPSSGQVIATMVCRREEIQQGRFADQAPDIYFQLRPGFASFEMIQPDPQLLFQRVPAISDTGFHLPDGIFIATGPGVAHGKLAERPNLVDLPPTVLYSAGLAIPDDFDGQVIAGAFTSEHLREQPPATIAATEFVPNEQAQQFSEEDDNEVRERLRSLGYIS